MSRSRATILFITLAVGVVAPVSLRGDDPPPAETTVYSTEPDALRRAFPKADAFARDEWVFTDAERRALAERLGRPLDDRSITVIQPRHGTESLGWAVVTEEIGKYHPFTFIVSMNSAAEITNVEALVYRESRGGEIVKKRFLKQFDGKSLADPIKVNRDILNITGATLSVRGMCHGIRKALTVVKEFYMTGARSTPVPPAPKDPAPPPLPPAGPKPDESGSPPPSKDGEGQSRGEPLLRVCRPAMGTLLTFSIYAMREGRPQDAVEMGFREAERWERLLSDYREDTAIGRLNRDGAAAAVELPSEVYQLLQRASDLNRRSTGAFDVTVGPLVDLWRECRRRDSPPSPGELSSVLARVGMSGLLLNSEPPSGAFSRERMRIDLGGMGKGTALNAIREVLEREGGVTSATIDFGGQWLVIGEPPGGGGWTMLVQDPVCDDSAVAWVVLDRGSISTSSNSERGVTIANRRYGHILDPRTGMPAEGYLSVTVVSTDAEAADAWSTALFVLGPGVASEVAEREGLSALFVTRGEGEVIECRGTTALAGRWGTTPDAGGELETTR